jgi:hypothetical protein
MVDELEKLITTFSHKQLSVRGDTEPLGAHIHFGIREQNKQLKIDDFWFDNIILFDILFGSKFKTHNGKARISYGQFGDYRCQEWGIEYRVLPTAIFADKKIAFIILKGFRNIVNYITQKALEQGLFELKISNCPTKEDYLTLCGWTEQEYKYFELFYKKLLFRDYSNIIQYWTKRNKNNKIQLIFIGSWGEDIKRKISNECNDLITRKEITFELKKTLVPYGFNGMCNNNKGDDINHNVCIGCKEEYYRDLIREIRYKTGKCNSNDLIPCTIIQFPDEVIA